MSISKKTKFTISLLIFSFIISSVSLFSQPLATGQSKFLGNIISNGNNIHSNFSIYWNQVTAENAGKWGSVESSKGVYNFGQLDDIYNYAISHGYAYKHHTLIWGAQQPSFLNSLDSTHQYQEIVKWIDTTGKRYANADFCDVVNEALLGHNPPDGQNGHANYKRALGGDGKTGWDWVVNSFKLARKYWPNTKLLINDYGILNSSSNTDAYIKIIKILKDSSLIDGIGCQGHGFENFDAATIRANLDKLAATGIAIYISEFDLDIRGDAAQKSKYKELFPVMWEHPGVKGITLWGYVQGETWIPNSYLITGTNRERPALQWLCSYFNKPYAPVLISPSGGTINESTTANLIWSRSNFATSYRVHVAGGRAFATVIVDTTLSDSTLHVTGLTADNLYSWKVVAMNDNDTSNYSPVIYFKTNTPTSIDERTEFPKEFSLSQNYPNPFNPTTSIKYSIPNSVKVILKIYDVLGVEVKTLVNTVQGPGQYSVTLDGGTLASGVYFYHLIAGNFNETKKLMLLK